MSNISHVKISTAASPRVGTPNRLETTASNGAFNSFGKVLRHPGMIDASSASDPFPLFAPTDAAVEKPPAVRLDNLFKPESRLFRYSTTTS